MPEAQSESTQNLFVRTIDSVVATAYRRAGLLSGAQSPSVAQGGVGRGLLGDISALIAAEGVFQRAVQVQYVALVLGQNQYPMPEDVIEVMGNGAYIDPLQNQAPFQANSETPVQMRDRDFWQSMTAKGSAGRPFIGYFAREAPLGTLYIWPTPSATEVGGHIRFQVQQTRPDLTDGTKTMPYERYWTDFFVWELAHYLAVENSLSMDRVQYLAGQALQKKATAKAYSRENVDKQAVINHATPWSHSRSGR